MKNLSITLIAAIGLSFALMLSCTKQEDNSLIGQEESINLDFRGGLPLAKLCCQETDLTSTFLSGNGICCTYRFTFTKNTYNDGVNTCGYEYPSDATLLFENSQTAIFDISVCTNSDGSCASRDVTVYSIGIKKNLPCATEAISTDCPCPGYTYAQGVNTGCNIASNYGCNPNGSQYQNTINDFACMCPDYVQGVKDGFNTYCATGVCGSCSDPQPAWFCDCVNGEWDCDP